MLSQPERGRLGTMNRRFQFNSKRLMASNWFIAAVVGCSAPLDFGGDRELKALAHSEYLSNVGDAWFDPVGASDIYYRCYSTRDGYDAWWRFVISEHDCDRLADLIAENNGGPTVIDWSTSSDYPTSWSPDDAPPGWWSKSSSVKGKSVAWCYRAGAAERHHGWYLLYEVKTKTLYCWHWNHQWSSNQCRLSDEQ